jgi:hypothetical protein
LLPPTLACYPTLEPLRDSIKQQTVTVYSLRLRVENVFSGCTGWATNDSVCIECFFAGPSLPVRPALHVVSLVSIP